MGGQFDYVNNDQDMGEHTQEFYLIYDQSPSGRKRMYIGQLKKKGSDI